MRRCCGGGGVEVSAWVGKVSHYRDTFIGGESQVKGIMVWQRSGEGEGGAGGFFKGQEIQSQARPGGQLASVEEGGGGPQGFHSGSRFFD